MDCGTGVHYYGLKNKLAMGLCTQIFDCSKHTNCALIRLRPLSPTSGLLSGPWHDSRIGPEWTSTKTRFT